MIYKRLSMLAVLLACAVHVNAVDKQALKDTIDQFGWGDDVAATKEQEMPQAKEGESPRVKNVNHMHDAIAQQRLHQAATQAVKDSLPPVEKSEEKSADGDSPANCDPVQNLLEDTVFTVELHGTQCFGLEQAEADSLTDCRNACCGASDCNVYQWCPMGGDCNPEETCWIATKQIDTYMYCRETDEVGWQSMAKARDISPVESIKRDLLAQNFSSPRDMQNRIKQLDRESKAAVLRDPELTKQIESLVRTLQSSDPTQQPQQQQQQQQQQQPQRTAPPLVEPEGSRVIVVDKETFHETIQSLPLALVEFYAPWCGHCKRLFPEFTAASEILHGRVSLVKIDLNDPLNGPIGAEFGIRGYPTLKVFMNGEFIVDFKAPRTTDGIVTFMETVIERLNQMESEEGAESESSESDESAGEPLVSGQSDEL